MIFTLPNTNIVYMIALQKMCLNCKVVQNHVHTCLKLFWLTHPRKCKWTTRICQYFCLSARGESASKPWKQIRRACVTKVHRIILTVEIGNSWHFKSLVFSSIHMMFIYLLQKNLKKGTVKSWTIFRRPERRLTDIFPSNSQLLWYCVPELCYLLQLMYRPDFW